MTDKEPWLPIGLNVAGTSITRFLESGPEWQVYLAVGGERVLVADSGLMQRWRDLGLLPEGASGALEFGGVSLSVLRSGCRSVLADVGSCPMPHTLADAMAFATSLARTRRVVGDVSLAEAIYAERFSILLPTFALCEGMADDVVLGRYLTGGVPVASGSSRRMASLVSWIDAQQLARLRTAAGLEVAVNHDSGASGAPRSPVEFRLPGREALAGFIREHVLDILAEPELYAEMGVEFPGAIVLHGPPGSGKTFAVERLIEHLEWPAFEISSSSVGSPYIHETGRKVAALFEEAAKAAPAVIVIDEMEAFLTSRDTAESSGVHRVEEVAEFLRRIPEARRDRVLIIGMTNRLDSIDEAVLRRGRIDHVLEVGMASVTEVEAVLVAALTKVPAEEAINPRAIAERLAGRPLSDIAFALREAGRLAAKAGDRHIRQSHLERAILALPSQAEEAGSRTIGFRP